MPAEGAFEEIEKQRVPLIVVLRSDLLNEISVEAAFRRQRKLLDRLEMFRFVSEIRFIENWLFSSVFKICGFEICVICRATQTKIRI